MKKVFLLAALAVVAALTACNRDDDHIDVSQLVGKWNFFHKGPKMYDSSLSYTFDKDGGYEKVARDVISGAEVTSTGTYEISADGGRITMLDRDGHCEEEYSVLRLTSRIMSWRAVAYGYQPEEEWFIKETD